MSQNDARDHSSIGLIDIATRAPAVLADLPVIARGMLTLARAQPNFKVSIGKIFQDRAERYGDRIFIRFIRGVRFRVFSNWFWHQWWIVDRRIGGQRRRSHGDHLRC